MRTTGTFVLMQSNPVDDLVQESWEYSDWVGEQTETSSVPGGPAVGIAIVTVIGAAILFIAKNFFAGAATRAGEDTYDRIRRKNKRKG